MQTLTSTATARRVEITVRGANITVDCPSWCVDRHGDRHVFLEDVSHHSEPVALTADGLLEAHLSCWPFSRDGSPYVSVEDADGECRELDPAAALALADQLDAHAAHLRRLAAAVTDSDPDVDEALRRVRAGR